MFIDVAKIRVIAGDGGNGKVNFHREKYVAAGGPDGGDGGRGGNIVFKVDDNLSTLLDFKYKKKYIADKGGDGGPKRMSGRDAKDLVIRVPRGTLLRDAETGAIIKDMSDDEAYVAARGGRGGWGNSHFATPTRQAPRFAKNGYKGESLELRLELKLLADVGLLGFPNVGKSTLLSVVSAARPKIANYHFTTLTPNLGVVGMGEGASFVIADIPGIIEGASEGAGLGHAFLRHIDRCRMHIHLVDASGSEGRDPVEDFETINEELRRYDAALASRPQIVAANKADIIEDRTLIDALRAHVEAKGMKFMEISAATGEGVRELMNETWKLLQELPPVQVYEAEYVAPEVTREDVERTKIEVHDGVYIAEGIWLERLMGSINFDDYESRMYFERSLQKAGLFEKLEEMGIQEGDTVDLYGFAFDYVK